MFNLESLLAPLFRYVRNATRHGLHQAFQAGTKDFTDDLAGLVRERQVIDHADLTRQLLMETPGPRQEAATEDKAEEEPVGRSKRGRKSQEVV